MAPLRAWLGSERSSCLQLSRALAGLREVIIAATHPSYSPAEHRGCGAVRPPGSSVACTTLPGSRGRVAAFKRWEVADGAPRNCRPPTFPVLRPGVLRWRDVRNPHDTLVFHPSPPLPFTTTTLTQVLRFGSRCFRSLPAYPLPILSTAGRLQVHDTGNRTAAVRGMSPIPTLPHPAYRAHVPRPARWAGSPPGCPLGWQYPCAGVIIKAIVYGTGPRGAPGARVIENGVMSL